MTKTEIKKAMLIFSPKNKTKIQRITALKKTFVIVETKQKILEGRYAFQLPCFDIQSTNVSICGKFLITTQTCKNLDFLKNFIDYNLNKSK